MGIAELVYRTFMRSLFRPDATDFLKEAQNHICAGRQLSLPVFPDIPRQDILS